MFSINLSNTSNKSRQRTFPFKVEVFVRNLVVWTEHSSLKLKNNINIRLLLKVFGEVRPLSKIRFKKLVPAGRSLTLNIPSDWAAKNGLTPGDTVYLVERDGELRVIPLSAQKKASQ
uniref:AbrB/MazE/SpoVT family DNA-binding domain-containing protein n=1 Tax=Fervidicoccus fontis TaxID=683846 RepID=A0A7J3SLH2_9CREN